MAGEACGAAAGAGVVTASVFGVRDQGMYPICDASAIPMRRTATAASPSQSPAPPLERVAAAGAAGVGRPPGTVTCVVEVAGAGCWITGGGDIVYIAAAAVGAATGAGADGTVVADLVTDGTVVAP